jgi:dUTP pyrophosphatase
VVRGPGHFRAKGAATVDAPELPVRRLHPDLPLPAYAHPGDAGADLRAAEELVLPPGGRATVGTGLALAVPDGYAGFVHPRSGLAARHGITVVNAPGTIDAGYRGEVRVVLLNTDPREPFTVRRGDRIAQLVVQPVAQARFLEVGELPATGRGGDGFGSTGR